MKELPFQLLLIGEELIRNGWSEPLGTMGYNVDVAGSGRQALERLEAGPVDLVLLDTSLSDMSGFALLRNLRRRYASSRLPVIMVTDGNRSDNVVKAFDLGANDFVVIPVDFSVLQARIQARLRGRRPSGLQESDPHADPAGEIAPGTVLDGKYEIGSLLGRGHFGRVYRARHLTLEREVAVKVLRPNRQNREELLERFRREGISACQIEHPNAVSVLDYSVSEGGLPFLVMELLEGHALRDEIRQRGPLTPLRCAVILLPVCEVLAEAHSLGIVHRDIKPHNIFLQQARRGEVIKVLDFGIAKLLDEVLPGQELTVEGSGPGTPAYMAPERFSEQPYDGQADVYSLGVTLYEMLTGAPPFHAVNGNPIKLALMHMSQKPPSLCDQNPGVPRPLEKVVLRALEKEPEARPQPAELARDFIEALGLELPASVEKSLGVA